MPVEMVHGFMESGQFLLSKLYKIIYIPPLYELSSLFLIVGQLITSVFMWHWICSGLTLYGF